MIRRVPADVLADLFAAVCAAEAHVDAKCDAASAADWEVLRQLRDARAIVRIYLMPDVEVEVTPAKEAA